MFYIIYAHAPFNMSYIIYARAPLKMYYNLYAQTSQSVHKLDHLLVSIRFNAGYLSITAHCKLYLFANVEVDKVKLKTHSKTQ